MASRHQDWLKQGERDQEHARRSLTEGYYEWACFAAYQAAEKAVRAVIQKHGGQAWSHSVTGLLQALPEAMRPPDQILDAARGVDKHYIPARYPNAHPQGAPYEYYTRAEAERALDQAGQIMGFCKGLLAGSAPDFEASAAGGHAPAPEPSRD
jgi:HEPN domain-containing protein